MYATISADVVSSTSLSQESMLKLNDHIKKCLVILEDRYSKFWGRIVRGDTIECVLPSPENALEVALILKTWVKSITCSIEVQQRALRFWLTPDSVMPIFLAIRLVSL